jgi:hypothetical protein
MTKIDNKPTHTKERHHSNHGPGEDLPGSFMAELVGQIFYVQFHAFVS